VKGLGAVTYDIHKREREFQHLTLSDEDVVKYLILYRSKVDSSYGSTTNININQAGDTFDFNQELIALYASLDKTIAKCNFKDKHIKLLELLFDGNTLQDIVSMDIGYKRSATYDLFDRMITKIVKANHSNWKSSMGANGYIKED
jgi:hypothetical protein